MYKKSTQSVKDMITFIKNGGLKQCDNDDISDLIWALYENTSVLQNTQTKHTEKS
tara:strand:- start:256 stop:420 length:165 start_codon:yes stop_codon:yes gene_type:complete